MANLNTKTLAEGVGDILAVADGIDASTARQIKDGEGTVSPLYITSARLGISVAVPTCELHIGGTNPQIRIGDDDAEDTSLCFMGNAQDFYIALDDTTDDLTIGTGTTIGSNVKMVVENGGNVGIGTATPAADLHVYGSGAITAIIGSSDAGGVSLVLDGDSDGDGAGSDYSYINHDTAGILNIVQDSPSGTNTINFGTAGTEDKIVIDANGRLGIQETTPDELLHITSTTASKPVIKLENVSDDATGAGIAFYKTTTESGSGGQVDADVLGNIHFYGRTGDTIPQLYNSIIGGIEDEAGGSGDGRLDIRQLVGDEQQLTMRIEKGRTISNYAAGAGAGGGIDAVSPTISIGNYNSEIVTTIFIDIGAGLILSSGSAGDVIGEDGVSSAYLTRITSTSGLVYKGEIICLEVPTTGDPDINICANASGSIAEDAAGEGEHVLANCGVHTLGLRTVFDTTVLVASGGLQNDYIYLTHGGTTAGTYDAGKFLIRFYGAQVDNYT